MRVVLSIVSLFNVEALRSLSSECHLSQSTLMIIPTDPLPSKPVPLHSLHIGNGCMLQPLSLLFNSPDPNMELVVGGWAMLCRPFYLTSLSFLPPSSTSLKLLASVKGEPRVIKSQIMGILTPVQ